MSVALGKCVNERGGAASGGVLHSVVVGGGVGIELKLLAAGGHICHSPRPSPGSNPSRRSGKVRWQARRMIAGAISSWLPVGSDLQLPLC